MMRPKKNRMTAYCQAIGSSQMAAGPMRVADLRAKQAEDRRRRADRQRRSRRSREALASSTPITELIVNPTIEAAV